MKENDYTIDDDTKFIVENWSSKTIEDISIEIGQSIGYVSKIAKGLSLGQPFSSNKLEGIQPTKVSVYWRRTQIPNIIVSEEGDIWDTEKGRCPSLVKLDNGALAVGTTKNGISYRSYVCNLVYEAFKGPIPNGSHVIHADGIQANDDISNLTVLGDRDIDKINHANESRMLLRRITAIDLCAKKDFAQIKPVTSIKSADDQSISTTYIPSEKKSKRTYTKRKVILFVNGQMAKIYRCPAHYANDHGLSLATVMYKLNHGDVRHGKITDDIRYAPEVREGK